jgi:hypothetical protein
MKLLSSLLVACLLSGITALAAETNSALPEFRGILSANGEQHFSLCSPGGAQTAWVLVGEHFADYEIVAFKASEEILVVRKNGAEFSLHLAGSQVKDSTAISATKATLADAEDVIRKMNFDTMIKKMVDQQKRSVLQMTKQMVAQMGADASDAEDVATFQGKILDTMFKAMNLEGMGSDFSRIYSEVFTKEELQGYSDFLSTPAGQAMVDKQSVVQQQIMAVMQPKIMAAMPEIQKMSAEFAQQMKAKKDAAKASAAATAKPNP